MKTQNETANFTPGEPLPDTGDILTDTMNDAAYWKGEAFRNRALTAEMRAALEASLYVMESTAKTHGYDTSIGVVPQVMAAIAKASRIVHES